MEGRSHDVRRKEGQARWEQFPDLLTVAEVMLLVSGRLLVSGSASAPGDLTCTPTPERQRQREKKKTCETSLDWRCSLTQLYFTWSLLGPGVGRSLFLKSFLLGSVRRFSSLSSPSIFFSLFPPNFSPSIPLHQPPHRIHHRSLASICCLAGVS